MGIKSELHEAILKRGGTVPPYGGIAAAMDELNKLPGGGGVSSWNDLTDKPFYSEVGEVAILPETTVEFNPDSGEGAIANVVTVVVGNTYTVYWNGTAYPCVAGSFSIEGTSVAALGNLGVMTGEGGTDDPFLLLALPADVASEMGVGAMCLALDGSASATVSIIGVIETIHGLEGKYLPEGTPYVEEFDDVIAESLTFNASGMSYDAIGNVTVGNIYNVNWGGVVYPCLARKVFAGASDYVCLGNAYLADEKLPITTEPFLIRLIPAEQSELAGGVTLVAQAESYPDNVSIIGGKKGHKIDSLCLPDDTADTYVVSVSLSANGVPTTPSRKWADAYAAFRSGKDLMLRVEGGTEATIYRLFKFNSSTFTFASLTGAYNGTVKMEVITWTENDTDELGTIKHTNVEIAATIT